MTNKQAAIEVLQKLRDAGYQALFAGGCVRDMLINRRPKDYDVATNATPKQVCGLFHRRIEVGVQFGVVIVLIGDEQIEVATFRTDGDYADGRRPDNITFAEPKADAMRRDFTINGMFYDPITDEVIDYVDGQRDLDAKIIRTIGKPQERFGEDYLRMLRAVRFSTELGYKIESATWKAVKKFAPRIEKISGERIAAEMEKMFYCDARAEGIDMLANSNILSVVFPSLTADEIEGGIAVLKTITKPVPLEKGLTAMLIKCKTGKALKLIRPLKLSNNQIKATGWILDNRTMLLKPEMKLSQLRPLLADKRFAMLFDIQRACQLTQGLGVENLELITERAQKLKDTVLLPPPLLNGNEIMSLGAENGPQIGNLCRKLYQQQLDEIIKTKDQAVAAIKKWINLR